MPPQITKGGPRPELKDYPNQAAYIEAVKKWNALNPPASGTQSMPDVQTVETKPIQENVVSQAEERNNWQAFGDGSFNIQEGNVAVGETPFVTFKVKEGQAPSVVVVLPIAGKPGSYQVVSREVLLDQLVKSILRDPNNVKYWKSQLKDYYTSEDAFQRSLSGGPVLDKDTEFTKALRKALNEIAVDNVSRASENFKSGTLNTAGFYDINSWIQSRTPLPGRQSTSTSTRNFTLEADAIADFMREVQIQVGDPALVDNVKDLAQAYWEKVHSEELKRMGKSTSVYDPITGKTISTSTGYQMPTEQLLKEWRINFITKGAIGKDNKVISTGIRNVDMLKLQDSGGDLGDNYTKLKGFAFDYGVRLSDEELKRKAAEAAIAGGSIEEQKRTIQLAARLKYPSLAPYIEGGLKASDIASQFVKRKTDVLELAEGAVDIFDTDVQAAMSGDKLMSDYDYELRLRSNPAWRKTKAANEGAAGFLDSILKMWGKVG